jgi:hypothetical protein
LSEKLLVSSLSLTIYNKLGFNGDTQHRDTLSNALLSVVTPFLWQ